VVLGQGARTLWQNGRKTNYCGQPANSSAKCAAAATTACACAQQTNIKKKYGHRSRRARTLSMSASVVAVASGSRHLSELLRYDDAVLGMVLAHLDGKSLVAASLAGWPLRRLVLLFRPEIAARRLQHRCEAHDSSLYGLFPTCDMCGGSLSKTVIPGMGSCVSMHNGGPTQRVCPCGFIVKRRLIIVCHKQRCRDRLKLQSMWNCVRIAELLRLGRVSKAHRRAFRAMRAIVWRAQARRNGRRDLKDFYSTTWVRRKYESLLTGKNL
jgi:hypothetical protein